MHYLINSTYKPYMTWVFASQIYFTFSIYTKPNFKLNFYLLKLGNQINSIYLISN